MNIVLTCQIDLDGVTDPRQAKEIMEKVRKEALDKIIDTLEASAPGEHSVHGYYRPGEAMNYSLARLETWNEHAARAAVDELGIDADRDSLIEAAEEAQADSDWLSSQDEALERLIREARNHSEMKSPNMGEAVDNALKERGVDLDGSDPSP